MVVPNPPTLSVGPVLPGIPTPTLSASPSGVSTINLTGSYTGPPTLATYTFEWATSLGGPFTPLATQASSAFAHTGRTSGVAYYYRVNVQTSEVPSRTSAYSSIATATTAGLSAPGTPTFSATTPAQTQVSYTASSGGATGYESQLNGGSFTNQGNLLTYLQTGLLGLTNPVIGIRAYDGAGNHSATASATLVILGANTLAADLFPRSCAEVFDNQNSYNLTAFKTIAAKYNIVLYSTYIGNEQSGGFSYPSVMSSIKSAATANGIVSRQIMYINDEAQALAPNNGGTYGTYVNWTNTVNAQNWWLRSSYPSGSIVGDFYDPTRSGALQNSININANTAYGGKKFFDAFAWYWWNVNTQGNAGSLFGEAYTPTANPYLDGFFLDNRFWTPRGTGAWHEDSASYAAGAGPPVSSWLQQGHKAGCDALRALAPSTLLIANNDTYNGYYIGAVVDPASVGLYDGVFNEGAIGVSYSVETFAGSLGLMSAMIALSEPQVRAGGTVILGQYGRPGGVAWTSNSQSGWVAADWQGARMGGAMACMRNWHWAPASGLTPETILFFDELQQGGVLGWLGTAIDGPQSAAWSNGVWRRRFSGGTVLWNPRGNGTPTVALGTTMHKCNHYGYGDAGVNNGAAVSIVTLQDSDGLFLRP